MIDLNCDVGESYGAWRMGRDEELIPLVTSANVACGFHAGDPVVIRRTVELALAHGVAVGAHPSYPDLQGFGRRSMHLSVEELEDTVLYQVAALEGVVRACGGELHHAKLHGALYNDAAVGLEVALACLRAVRRLSPSPLVYVLAGSEMLRAAEELGLRAVEEGFADRRYNPDGSLVSRSLPGALITDPEAAAEQAAGIALRSRVETERGSIEVRAGTLCVHGDNPSAVGIARAVRERLSAGGVELRSP